MPLSEEIAEPLDDAEFDRAVRTMNQIFDAVETPYRFVKIGVDPIPEGTIDVDLDDVGPALDLKMMQRFIYRNQDLNILERYGWTMLATSPDGRHFRIRPTATIPLP